MLEPGISLSTLKQEGYSSAKPNLEMVLHCFKEFCIIVNTGYDGPRGASGGRELANKVRKGERRRFLRATGLLGAARDRFTNYYEAASCIMCSIRLARGVFPVLRYPGSTFGSPTSIRDDRYLIGGRLHNFGEDSGERRNEAANDASKAQNSDTRGTELIQYDHEVDVGLRLRRANRQEA
ncbi:RING/U-box superfamily protein [Actinidia rufa]|uniref:RING/U-box superfamily protein n=1 Tax=Actinidia rufa TaxID=165716 RepID=A0A7J0EUD3_9ERIC|nr:RING/U-box superfamily protein [Actinidia rufa]